MRSRTLAAPGRDALGTKDIDKSNVTNITNPFEIEHRAATNAEQRHTKGG